MKPLITSNRGTNISLSQRGAYDWLSTQQTINTFKKNLSFEGYDNRLVWVIVERKENTQNKNEENPPALL